MARRPGGWSYLQPQNKDFGVCLDVEMTSRSPVPRAGDGDSGRLTILLDRAADGRDSQVWSDLWTELYHHGSLDPSHPLVLPALMNMAEGADAETAAAALHLAGALLIQADQRYETRKLRDQHTPEVVRLLAAANRWRRTTADRKDYCDLLEGVLNLEGEIPWAEDLVWLQLLARPRTARERRRSEPNEPATHQAIEHSAHQQITPPASARSAVTTISRACWAG